MVQGKARHSLKTTLFNGGETSKSSRRKRAMAIPAANVDETKDEYILSIASPGFKRENIQVMIENDNIIIAAAKKTSQASCIHDRCEYNYTTWKRTFSLPDDADTLLTRARYIDGELIIRIPRGKKDNLPVITNIYVY